VEDTSINSDDYTFQDDYWGIFSNHTITGASSKEFGIDDRIRGIYSELTFTDGVGGGGFSELTSGRFHVNVNETGLTTSGSAHALYGYAYLEGGAELDNIYGSCLVTDIDGGTVDTSVYGQSIDVDIESGCSIGDHVKGLYINVDSDVNPTGNVFGLDVWVQGTGVDASADTFLRCRDQENSDTVAQITALAGVATFDSGDFSGAPDYAEYFESKSGSAIAIGSTVKLDGDKIVVCEEGDTPIGVVRPKWSSSVVCGSAPLRWAGKYLKDDYDEVQMENYTKKKWIEEVDFDEYIKRGKTEEEQQQYSKVEGSKAKDAVLDEDGKEIEPAVDAVPDTYFREHCYHSDRIPEGITAPDDAETLTPVSQRKKLNPDYDPSQDYVKRADRDEWCLVGLLGQIPITKGQPTGTWIKMKDVSDTVEMYFVK
jgi:hypothetical protein